MESSGVLLAEAVSQIRFNQDAQEQHKILHGHFDAGMKDSISLSLPYSLFEAMIHNT